MGNVMGKFIQPLSRLFPLPKASAGHEDEFFEAYFSVLKTFDDTTLTEAVEHIRSTRTQRSFPLPAECNLACAEAIKGEAIRIRQDAKPNNRHEQRDFGERYPEWSERSIRRTDEFFTACPFSKSAVAEDWAWTLWTWIQDNGRCPDVHEAVKIKSIGVVRFKEIGELVDNSSRESLIGTFLKMRDMTRGRLKEIVTAG